jgi:hypothetical protein
LDSDADAIAILLDSSFQNGIHAQLAANRVRILSMPGVLNDGARRAHGELMNIAELRNQRIGHPRP